MKARACLLTILIGVLAGFSRVIQVPGDHPTITQALLFTENSDTVWVHPGEYRERIILPAHDIQLVSDFFFTEDSSALVNTIIDASDWAEDDTGSVITAVFGNTRSTLICGFTLTGGHGWTLPDPPNDSRWGGALLIMDSHPTIVSCRMVGNNSSNYPVLWAEESTARIAHCEIADNCGEIGLLACIGNLLFDEPFVFEWNDIHGNYACGNLGPYLFDPGVRGDQARLLVRYNHFHDYEGRQFMGVELYRSRGECIGNRFERLSSPLHATLLLGNEYDNTYSDNLFLNCTFGEGSCVTVSGNTHPINFFRSLFQRNWFENITSGLGPAAIFLGNPNAEVTDNVVINCVGGGTMGFSYVEPQGCDVAFARNQFFSNRRDPANSPGTALYMNGLGPPCSILDNWFEDNAGIAVGVYTSNLDSIDLRQNYWGDPSGPYHPINHPTGLGDTVTANSMVWPWLTEPPELDVSVNERFGLGPEEWTVENAFPNPFNASTNLRIITSKSQPFEVVAYNIAGQRVARVWQGVIAQKTPTLVRWNAIDDRHQRIASGIYYLVAVPRGPGKATAKTAKVVLLR